MDNGTHAGGSESSHARASLPLPGGNSGGWLASSLYSLIVIVLAYPLILNLGRSIVGYAVTDNFYNVWYIWRFKQDLTAGHDPAHTHLIYALLPSVQVFVEYWVADLLALVVQQVTGPLAAYNLVVIVSFILSGFTMYLLTGEFAEHWLARFSAGFLYTFSTYHLFRAAAHLGLLTIEWLPFCAWRIIALYRRPSILNAVLAGVGLALVPLSDIYYLPYFAIPFIALCLVWVLAVDRGWFAHRRNVYLTACATVLAAAITIPALSGYLAVDADVRSALSAVSDDSTSRYSADFLAFVLPNPGNPVFGRLTTPVYRQMRSDQWIEEGVFLGYPVLLLSIAALLSGRCRRRGSVFWMTVGLCGLVLALGPDLQVGGRRLFALPPYGLLYGWNPLSAFRAPDRLVVLTLVSSGVLSALALDDFIARIRTRWALIALSIGVAATLAFSLEESAVSSLSFPSIPATVPAVYNIIAHDRGTGLVLELPTVFDAPQYQYFQTVHHHPLVNGYVSRQSQRMIESVAHVPYLALLNPVNPRPGGPHVSLQSLDPTPRFVRALRDRHITYVLLNDWVYSDRDYRRVQRFLTGSLGHPFYRGTGLMAWSVGH